MLKKIYLNILEKLLPSSYFIQHLPDLTDQIHPDFKTDARLYNSRCDRITRDGVRVLALKNLMNMVLHLSNGDYAELGTFRGNFASLIFKYKHPESNLFCFDTFEGFHGNDVKIENIVTKKNVGVGRFSDTSIKMVKKNILKDNSDHKRLHLIKGHFPDTFKGFENKPWRFVHLDADLYKPTKEGVKAFWPNIVPGGILLIHDYNGGYIGTKQAIDEYLIPQGLRPVPVPDKSGSVLFIKRK